MTIESTLERLRAEYLEMPGLRLSVAQIERLCGVDRIVCHAVLDVLVDARVLRVNADGTYARLTDGPRRHRPRSISSLASRAIRSTAGRGNKTLDRGGGGVGALWGARRGCGSTDRGGRTTTAGTPAP